MLINSFSGWLDLDSANIIKQELEEAFDLLELGSKPCKLDKEEFIMDLLEKKYNDEYSSLLDRQYEEFKNEGFRG